MDKPKEAIERMRKEIDGELDVEAILAWADSIPDDAVCVVWPKGLTRERLRELIHDLEMASTEPHEAASEVLNALRALAAIAPVRKKRMVNLWEGPMTRPIAIPIDEPVNDPGWRKVGGPFEIEE